MRISTHYELTFNALDYRESNIHDWNRIRDAILSLPGIKPDSIITLTYAGTPGWSQKVIVDFLANPNGFHVADQILRNCYDPYATPSTTGR